MCSELPQAYAFFPVFVVSVSQNRHVRVGSSVGFEKSTPHLANHTESTRFGFFMACSQSVTNDIFWGNVPTGFVYKITPP